MLEGTVPNPDETLVISKQFKQENVMVSQTSDSAAQLSLLQQHIVL